MRIALPAAVTAVLLVAACGQGGGSGLNPGTWFQNKPKVETMEAAPVVPGDPRPRIDQIVSMAIEPKTGGVIVRATGLPATQGYWEAALVRGPDEDGRISFDFLVVPPVTPQQVSTQPSREITAGAFVTTRDLQGIREIVVRGAQNTRSARP